ncbi:MAG: hypothetical protein QOC89_955 [Paraburkholderia sp.]|nr:hypothetical protein [Paraburkholderia sp.]
MEETVWLDFYPPLNLYRQVCMSQKALASGFIKKRVAHRVSPYKQPHDKAFKGVLKARRQCAGW